MRKQSDALLKSKPKTIKISLASNVAKPSSLDPKLTLQ